MFKAAAVVSDTKRVLKILDGQGLAELRALQKPDNEIEDLLAAIIIIGTHGNLWHGGDILESEKVDFCLLRIIRSS